MTAPASASYVDFLKTKAPRVECAGFEPGPVHPSLYPFQVELVEWAIRRGRAAIFADCGMGKSFMQLEWARQILAHNLGAVLIVAPIAVGQQTIEEGKKLGVQVERAMEPGDIDERGGLYITNYERLERFVGVAPTLAGIVLDESSILKSMDGKTRSLLIKEFSRVPYRLCCTATPAPNDVSELANHAEFLGAMSRVEMLATFFVHDSDEGEWRLKGHAAGDMWRWMAQWARFVRRPSDLGYPDQGWALPPLYVSDEIVHTGLDMKLGGIASRPKIRKATLAARVERTARIILGDAWTPKNVTDSRQSSGAETSPSSSGNGGSESATASPSTSSTFSRPSKEGAAPVAEAPPADSGSASMSTTTTGQGTSAGSSASRATEGSDSSLTTPSCSSQLAGTYSGELWIVWCGLNDEEAALKEALGDLAVVINGKDSEEARETKMESWKCGRTPVLVSKAKIFGWGMNFQNCHRMAFLGLDDSYELLYQAIRRCWRFGQTQTVDVRIVVSDVEGAIADNVKRKEEEAKAMAESIIAAVGEEQRPVRQDREDKYEPKTQKGKGYLLALGDSVERIKEIPDAYVGFSIYSPPFASLYTYSSSSRDMGNSKNYEEFFKHYSYLIPELLRVTKPGRRTAVHVAQVGLTKATHGVIGWRDFRADVVKAYVAAGWVYDGEICIDKDPQAQAIRTKSKQLMFVQKERDSAWLRPAMADYILLFRHPGENTEPVKSDVSNEEWILFARPIWYGIRESNVLRGYKDARGQEDEKHICPLQLETIERCIRLWSNPGDVVLSPFAGIGSEGYVSLRFGRKFIGIELKESYWQQGCRNLEQALADGPQSATVPVDLPKRKTIQNESSDATASTTEAA